VSPALRHAVQDVSRSPFCNRKGVPRERLDDHPHPLPCCCLCSTPVLPCLALLSLATAPCLPGESLELRLAAMVPGHRSALTYCTSTTTR